MSQKVKIVNRGPKKDVRRLRFVITRTFTTTQADHILHLAESKETIMGMKLRITVIGTEAVIAESMAEENWVIYTALDGTKFVSLNSGATVLDTEVAKEQMFHGRELASRNTAYTYSIESKAKRKLGKGQALLLSLDSDLIRTNCKICIQGIVYIGE